MAIFLVYLKNFLNPVCTFSCNRPITTDLYNSGGLFQSSQFVNSTPKEWERWYCPKMLIYGLLPLLTCLLSQNRKRTGQTNKQTAMNENHLLTVTSSVCACCMLLKFATVLYADRSQLINLMPNHQPWLSNEIETLVNRKGRGCIYLLRAVQGVVNLSSSIKTIETNGVTEGIGNNWKKI